MSWAREIPVLRNNKSLTGRALGGWEFAGFSIVRRGQPFTVASGRGNSLQGTNAGYNQDRPDLLGDPRLPTDRPKSAMLRQYFDATKFQQNLPGTYGSSGRNILIGPGLVTFDLMLNKRFRLWSESKVSRTAWRCLQCYESREFQ